MKYGKGKALTFCSIIEEIKSNEHPSRRQLNWKRFSKKICKRQSRRDWKKEIDLDVEEDFSY